MSATDFANVSIALYYLRNIGNDDVVSKFYLWERIMQASVSYSEEYSALVNEPMSDYDYKVRLASIVQKHLYYMLPTKYKTMEDEEYDMSMKLNSDS